MESDSDLNALLRRREMLLQIKERRNKMLRPPPKSVKNSSFMNNSEESLENVNDTSVNVNDNDTSVLNSSDFIENSDTEISVQRKSHNLVIYSSSDTNDDINTSASCLPKIEHSSSRNPLQPIENLTLEKPLIISNELVVPITNSQPRPDSTSPENLNTKISSRKSMSGMRTINMQDKLTILRQSAVNSPAPTEIADNMLTESASTFTILDLDTHASYSVENNMQDCGISNASHVHTTSDTEQPIPLEEDTYNINNHPTLMSIPISVFPDEALSNHGGLHTGTTPHPLVSPVSSAHDSIQSHTHTDLSKITTTNVVNLDVIISPESNINTTASPVIMLTPDNAVIEQISHTSFASEVASPVSPSTCSTFRSFKSGLPTCFSNGTTCDP